MSTDVMAFLQGGLASVTTTTQPTNMPPTAFENITYPHPTLATRQLLAHCECPPPDWLESHKDVLWLGFRGPVVFKWFFRQ